MHKLNSISNNSLSKILFWLLMIRWPLALDRHYKKPVNTIKRLSVLTLVQVKAMDYQKLSWEIYSLPGSTRLVAPRLYVPQWPLSNVSRTNEIIYWEPLS